MTLLTARECIDHLCETEPLNSGPGIGSYLITHAAMLGTIFGTTMGVLQSGVVDFPNLAHALHPFLDLPEHARLSTVGYLHDSDSAVEFQGKFTHTPSMLAAFYGRRIHPVDTKDDSTDGRILVNGAILEDVLVTRGYPVRDQICYDVELICSFKGLQLVIQSDCLRSAKEENPDIRQYFLTNHTNLLLAYGHPLGMRNYRRALER
ncbi:hypothetical protein ACFL0V_06295 [Nanoarchaeota archaeon]